MATEYRPIPRLAVGVYPLTNVTPFTYRDGVTYERLLHQLIDRMNTIIGEVNTNNQALFDVVIENMNITIDAVNAALGEQTDEVDQKLADLTLYVDTEVQKVVDMRDDMEEFRDETETFRNQAETFAANTVELQDEAVALLVGDDDSDTRAQLNSVFVPGAVAVGVGFDASGLSSSAAALATLINTARMGVITIPEGEYDLSGWSTVTLENRSLELQALGAVKFVGDGTSLFKLKSGSMTITGIEFVGFDRIVEFDDNDTDVIDALRFRDVVCRQAVGSGGLISYFPTTDGVMIQEFEMTRTSVYDSRQGMHYRGRVGIATVDGGEFANLQHYAIRFGKDWSAGSWGGSVRVHGTHIRDMFNPETVSGTETNGIAVWADFCDIQHNTIERIANAIAQDCEGIYTKVRRGKVDNNILLDACLDEGSIVAKIAPLDPNSVVGGKEMLTINSNVIGFTTVRNYSIGVSIQRSHVECKANMVDGASVCGIRVGWRSDYSDITIASNQIKMGAAGAVTGGVPVAGILVYGYGADVSVTDNTVVTDIGWGVVLATDEEGDTRYPTTVDPIGKRYTVSRNIIVGSGTRGLVARLLTPVDSVRIVGNQVSGFTDHQAAITALGCTDWWYEDNYLEGGKTEFFGVPSNLRVRGDEFRNAGTDSLSSSGTTKTVTHGLNAGLASKATKADVIVTPNGSWGAATKWWVAAVGTGSFQFAVDIAPGSGLQFAWQVSLENRVLA